VLVLRERGLELALDIREKLPHLVGAVEVEPTGDRLQVTVEPRGDQYGLAWSVCQQLAPLWLELLGPAGVGLTLSVATLHWTIEAPAMTRVAEGGTRTEWAAAAQRTLGPARP
jgi:hypothetical protein